MQDWEFGANPMEPWILQVSLEWYKLMAVPCWSWVSSVGCLWDLLVHVPSILSAFRCVELVSDHLHPFLSLTHPSGDGVFHQDKCSSHTSRTATECLQEHSADFETTRYPPRSSGLYPIEHLWDIAERNVWVRRTSSANMTELWTTVEDAWLAILVEHFLKLVESLISRVEIVIKARGSCTR